MRWVNQSTRVIQASGMVSVQAQCSCDEALAMLQERARTFDVTAEDMARAVIEHRVRFGITTRPQTRVLGARRE